MAQRPAFIGPLCALAIALVFVAPTILDGCNPSASKDSGAFVDYDLAALTIAAQAKMSDIVVVGKVVSVDPARWNSPDGKSWSPPEEEASPIVYTTFYVEPVEILHGTATWGPPIAFRSIGGTLADGSTYRVNGSSDSVVAVGQEVIAFGRTVSCYGPKGGDTYHIQGYAGSDDERSLTLEEFKAKLTAALPGK